MSRAFGAALLIAAFATPAMAQEGSSLGIGDPVPAIDIQHFFQGEAVEEFSKEKTYVLEFWATW